MLRLGEHSVGTCVPHPAEVLVSERPEKHGVFYPRGYVIVIFDSEDKAESVRRRLLDGGYDEDDVHILDTERVRKGTSEDLKHLAL